MIKVVNKNKVPNHIYCGRGSALGNPFSLSSESLRSKVCAQYEDWFYNEIDEDGFLDSVALANVRSMSYNPSLNPATKQLIMIFNLAQEGDVNLGCFCAPRQCHCDTIKNFIENKLEELEK